MFGWLHIARVVLAMWFYGQENKVRKALAALVVLAESCLSLFGKGGSSLFQRRLQLIYTAFAQNFRLISGPEYPALTHSNVFRSTKYFQPV
jgi:hypothetical protein